ncbi:unnamed protein product [Effrenium voratum]|uniref:Uncharacterized protein n=1 Tax=Effrenium voratum TaxID=2562239 RepID=A0AA36MXJ7_9DINO|nr:unnamed protein product [Effrenium voratum]
MIEHSPIRRSPAVSPMNARFYGKQAPQAAQSSTARWQPQPSQPSFVPVQAAYPFAPSAPCATASAAASSAQRVAPLQAARSGAQAWVSFVPAQAGLAGAQSSPASSRMSQFELTREPRHAKWDPMWDDAIFRVVKTAILEGRKLHPEELRNVLAEFDRRVKEQRGGSDIVRFSTRTAFLVYLFGCLDDFVPATVETLNILSECQTNRGGPLPHGPLLARLQEQFGQQASWSDVLPQLLDAMRKAAKGGHCGSASEASAILTSKRSNMCMDALRLQAQRDRHRLVETEEKLAAWDVIFQNAHCQKWSWEEFRDRAASSSKRQRTSFGSTAVPQSPQSEQGVKYGSFLWDYYEENSAEDCGSMDWRTFRSMPATQTTMDRLGVDEQWLWREWQLAVQHQGKEELDVDHVFTVWCIMCEQHGMS